MTDMCKEMCGLMHGCNVEDCKIVQEYTQKLRQNLLEKELLIEKLRKKLSKHDKD
jgi:hypothetical protein